MVHPFWGCYIFWIGFFVVFSFRWLKSWPFYPRSLEVTNSLSKRITFFTIPPKKKVTFADLPGWYILFVHLFRKSGGWNQHNTPRSRSKANRQSPVSCSGWVPGVCSRSVSWSNRTEENGWNGGPRTYSFWWWFLKNINQNGFIFPQFREWKLKKNGSNELKILKSKNGFNQIRGENNTLPKTNIAPENRPSQKETSIPTIHFQVLC